ncbi:unnamed protein product [Phytophthora fragariaefolia]|uniref:Unnamed protein product n=1 Tax=Phytophthora fragariaefolia TaxID=1490495 RepID=A0A9W6U3W2_9STRA|nr:unnamed protein product [Phytophthora fragariaefolia]
MDEAAMQHADSMQQMFACLAAMMHEQQQFMVQTTELQRQMAATLQQQQQSASKPQQPLPDPSTQDTREYRAEGITMPKFSGTKDKDVADYMFSAKLYFESKNVKYGADSPSDAPCRSWWQTGRDQQRFGTVMGSVTQPGPDFGPTVADAVQPKHQLEDRRYAVRTFQLLAGPDFQYVGAIDSPAHQMVDAMLQDDPMMSRLGAWNKVVPLGYGPVSLPSAPGATFAANDDDAGATVKLREVTDSEFESKKKDRAYVEIYNVRVKTSPQTKSIPRQLQSVLEKFADQPNPISTFQGTQEALERFVADLLRKNWIQVSDSPWASNIFGVPKKDPVTGKIPSKLEWLHSNNPNMPIRWVINYRLVDAASEVAKIPLPHIKELYDRMEGARVFSILDLASGALVKSNVKWSWLEPPRQAFNAIKLVLQQAPVLRLPDFDKPFIVTIDASHTYIGGVLSQIHEGADLPVAFYSKKLGVHELNWPVHEKELFAIKQALVHWHHYLHGARFDVFTDNSACKWVLQHPRVSGRFARWLDFFASFDFKIHHRPGSQNVVADALSRPPVLSAKSGGGYEGQRPTNDPVYKKLGQSKQSNEEYEVRGGLVFLKTEGNVRRLCVPNQRQLRLDVIHNVHDAAIMAHSENRRTQLAAALWYFWLSMDLDIKAYVQSYESCMRYKSSTGRKSRKLQPIPLPEACWDAVSTDFITHLPVSDGFNAIMIVVDKLSKRPVYIPTHTTATAENTAKLFFNSVIRHYGIPSTTISDRDPKFTSKFGTALISMMKIKAAMTTAHKAQADEQTERQNRTVEDSLRCSISYHGNDWNEHLPMIEYAHATLVSSSWKMSPFFNPLGSAEGDQPVARSRVEYTSRFVQHRQEVIERARKNLLDAQEAQKRFYDRRRTANPFKVGNLTLLSTQDLNISHATAETTLRSQKFIPRFIGPYPIVELRRNVVLLKLPANLKHISPRFNIDRLKVYNSNPDRFVDRVIPKSTPVIFDDDGEPLQVVEALVKKRIFNRHPEYLVKWHGLPHHENTWERERNLKHVSHWQALLKDLR